MLSPSIFAFLASSLYLPTGSATPLTSNALSTVAENPAISLATYTDTRCSGGQHDYQVRDDGCYQLPGQGLHVWWFAETCRAFIYKGAGGSGCDPASGERQVTVGQCYDIAQYHTIKVFCH